MSIAVAIVGLISVDVIAGTFGAVLIGLVVILLMTSLADFCPLYRFFGINTRPTEKRKVT